MSLVKTDKDGRIRKSWAEKKTTKRLEKILYKMELIYLELRNTAIKLKGLNINIDEICTLRNKYVYLSYQLKVIIIRRKPLPFLGANGTYIDVNQIPFNHKLLYEGDVIENLKGEQLRYDGESYKLWTDYPDKFLSNWFCKWKKL